jgi:hypothetical protein
MALPGRRVRRECVATAVFAELQECVARTAFEAPLVRQALEPKSYAEPARQDASLAVLPALPEQVRQTAVLLVAGPLHAALAPLALRAEYSRNVAQWGLGQLTVVEQAAALQAAVQVAAAGCAAGCECGARARR